MMIIEPVAERLVESANLIRVWQTNDDYSTGGARKRIIIIRE